MIQFVKNNQKIKVKMDDKWVWNCFSYSFLCIGISKSWADFLFLVIFFFPIPDFKQIK